MKAERYKEITGSNQFDSFYKNIHCLAEHYGKARGYQPQIRFITMILNINRDEIGEIVKYCSEKLHSGFHELRTPYISIYENMKWNETQLMEEEECRQIEEELNRLGLPIVMDIHSKKGLITIPPAEIEEEGQERERQDEVRSADPLEPYFEEIRLCMHQEFFFLRFHPSGLCTENVTKESYSIENEQDMAAFYRNKLRRLCKRRTMAFICPIPVLEGSAKAANMKVMIEKMTANEQCLTIAGWYRTRKSIAEGRILMVRIKIVGGDEKDLFTLCSERPDLDKGDAKNCGAGFILCLDRELITSETVELEFSFVNKDTMRREYRYEYPYCIEWKHKIK